MAPHARRYRKCCATSPNAAYAQRQRANGRRHAARRTRAPNGVPPVDRRCAGGAQPRPLRGARHGPRSDRLRARCASRRPGQRRIAVACATSVRVPGLVTAGSNPPRRGRNERCGGRETRATVAIACGIRCGRVASGGGTARSRAIRRRGVESDAPRTRGYHRSAGQRGRRSRHRPRPRRRRTACAEGEPARAHQQRHSPAQPGARDRDPGRNADPVADVGSAAGARRTSIRWSSTATRASRS